MDYLFFRKYTHLLYGSHTTIRLASFIQHEVSFICVTIRNSLRIPFVRSHWEQKVSMPDQFQLSVGGRVEGGDISANRIRAPAQVIDSELASSLKLSHKRPSIIEL